MGKVSGEKSQSEITNVKFDRGESERRKKWWNTPVLLLFVPVEYFGRDYELLKDLSFTALLWFRGYARRVVMECHNSLCGTV